MKKDAAQKLCSKNGKKFKITRRINDHKILAAELANFALTLLFKKNDYYRNNIMLKLIMSLLAL